MARSTLVRVGVAVRRIRPSWAAWLNLTQPVDASLCFVTARIQWSIFVIVTGCRLLCSQLNVTAPTHAKNFPPRANADETSSGGGLNLKKPWYRL